MKYYPSRFMEELIYIFLSPFTIFVKKRRKRGIVCSIVIPATTINTFFNRIHYILYGIFFEQTGAPEVCSKRELISDRNL